MALINCKYCGEKVSDRANKCPHCGAVLVKIVEHEKQCLECHKLIPLEGDICPFCGCPQNRRSDKQKTNSTTQNASKRNGIPAISTRATVLIIGVMICICSILFLRNNVLAGDNKIVYEIILNAADNFKDADSLRIESGSLGLEKDCVFCGISTTNGLGSRTTSYFYVSKEGWVLAEDNPSNVFTNTDGLDFELINKKLAKALSG